MRYTVMDWMENKSRDFGVGELMDIQKIFDDLIKKYGKNDGYKLPTIEWSKENMFARYGEYQHWRNCIVVSRLLDTDRISMEAVAHVIYHEYLHQMYREHEGPFEEKMKTVFDSSMIQTYMQEINDYFGSIKKFPAAPKHDFPLDENAETVFVYLPFEPENDDSYWMQFNYFNHYLIGCLRGNVPAVFCEKKYEQAVFLVDHGDADYIVGWCQDLQIYPDVRIVDLSPYQMENMDYSFRCPSSRIRLLLPPCVRFGLYPKERPLSLKKNGICYCSEISKKVLRGIFREINDYSLDFHMLGMADDCISCVSSIETDDVDVLIEESESDENRGMRAIWALNKAASLEKSYRTYTERALAFEEICIFDEAIKDYKSALSYDAQEDADIISKEWVEERIRQLQGTIDEFENEVEISKKKNEMDVEQSGELMVFFKSIIEQDKCSVVICNLEHEIIYMNPAATINYEKYGGKKLIGQSIMDCHSGESREKMKRVVEWFDASEANNLVYTAHNEKQNKDVYMVALRDGEKLIGYYEKHEFRDKETMRMYDLA